MDHDLHDGYTGKPTPFNFDYTEYSDGPETPVAPCRRDSENILGAQLSILYYIMFLFSFVGNGLVLLIMYRFEKLTTVTNILLLNLVFSSLILMSSLPFWGIYLQMQVWVFGSFMCKLLGSVYYLGFYSSVLFLALLTFDRHLSVVYSLGSARLRNARYAVASCAVVWLLSGLACINPMILQNTFVHHIANKTYCQDYGGSWKQEDLQKLKVSRVFLQLGLFYVFPLLLIIYCYVRIALTVISSKIVTKFKTVRLIFVIVLLFFACWTPYNVVLLTPEGGSCEDARGRGYGLHITRNIAYIYFCISPIFYTFVGKKFQNYCRKLLQNRFPRSKRHISVSQSSRTNVSTKSTRNEP